MMKCLAVNFFSLFDVDDIKYIFKAKIWRKLHRERSLKRPESILSLLEFYVFGTSISFDTTAPTFTTFV